MLIEVTHNMFENVYCYILHYYADWLSGRSKINLLFIIQCLASEYGIEQLDI
jgi:hypothetical protein